ncbi:response regulator transcription factor [Amnibacterium kyonggiense]|uniref:Winged helix family two component transcriptional regulator n=1 Tax=Amnibacterium kyonggiense TaxID=595671 RepID=A0A4V3EBD5_9MICO|nr:response regulator transcription factor [Amnibacterium kyonggiense]TDS81054.1 winged helix family two component transcriptional regulator [Amnibacterium kyonggiense]
MNGVTTATRRLTVGLVEDDPAIVRLLGECLTTVGHTGVFARSGAEAIRRFTGDEDIDVLVLDVGLPDMDGRDLCRVLRANGQQAPTMFLTALGQVHDVVQGFAAGGLDYVVKPFALAELVARIEALARRVDPPAAVEGLHLDAERFALCAGDEARLLTPTEFRLAAELLAHSGRLVRRGELVSAAWVPGARVNGNTLDTYLHRIRRHLTALGSAASIHTVRGVGYILRGA